MTAACMFAACDNTLPLPEPSDKDYRIVLLGELTGGDTIRLRAGRSLPVISNAQAPVVPQNISITIREGAGQEIGLREREDHLKYSLLTLPFTHPSAVTAGITYRIDARHPQMPDAEVTVQIPAAFTASATKRRDEFFGDSVLSIDIEIEDANAAQAQYVIEAVKEQVQIAGYFNYQSVEYLINANKWLYDSLKSAGVTLSERYDTLHSGAYARQTMYTTDPASENLSGGQGGRLFRRVFLPGKAFSNGRHRTNILLPLASLYDQSGRNARTIVYVKSVAADYYSFLKEYEQYDESTALSNNANPQRLKGNVSGGLGMIGGVSRWQIAVVY